MLTKEQNETLTQVGAGTLMGDLLRRYWHVVGISSELDQDPVRPVRILGEDLTLYRDAAGKLGLIAERCAHRGLSLAYGIPQENGLRCAYHGWTYNEQGQVVDMPFEPACLPLKLTAYPVQELGGLVFAYLGPAPAPLLPRWDLFVKEDEEKEVAVEALPCNWLQCMDNSLDPIHFEHLHSHFGNYMMKKLGRPPMLMAPNHLKIEFDTFEYGIYKRRLVEGETEDCDDWQIGHPILFPNILAQGDAVRRQFQIRVPMDDTHTMHYSYIVRPTADGAAPRPIRVNRTSLFHDPEAVRTGKIVADIVVLQDLLAWVAQGPVSDRTTEHLVTSDRGIHMYRNMLLENVERVKRGEDPIGVIRDPAKNEPMIEIKRETKGYTAFGLNGSVQDLRPVGA